VTARTEKLEQSRTWMQRKEEKLYQHAVPSASSSTGTKVMEKARTDTKICAEAEFEI